MMYQAIVYGNGGLKRLTATIVGRLRETIRQSIRRSSDSDALIAERNFHFHRQSRLITQSILISTQTAQN